MRPSYFPPLWSANCKYQELFVPIVVVASLTSGAQYRHSRFSEYGLTILDLYRHKRRSPRSHSPDTLDVRSATDPANLSLPGTVAMFAVGVGMRQVQGTLPNPVYALLSGLNSAITGVIAYAGLQLAQRAVTCPMDIFLIATSASVACLYEGLCKDIPC
jgi:hypothetical protein